MNTAIAITLIIVGALGILGLLGFALWFYIFNKVSKTQKKMLDKFNDF